MARVSVPFTEGHYYGRGERPNTELADNSPSACREIHNSYHSILVRIVRILLTMHREVYGIKEPEEALNDAAAKFCLILG